MPKIKIDQFGKELEAKPGENILGGIFKEKGIDINAYVWWGLGIVESA